MLKFKTAIVIPCFKRPEYTRSCLESIVMAQDYKDVDFYLIDDGSKDNTSEIFKLYSLPGRKILHEDNRGLRATLISFFTLMQKKDYDIIGKMDNDCCVPPNWLDDILKIMHDYPLDIVSPNVYPSDAANKLGDEMTENVPYKTSKHVGGLWFMRKNLLDDMAFEQHDISGITGAFQLLKQIIYDKEPTVAWLPNIIVQDIGHWSGKHPDHIKTGEHEMYYAAVGRKVTW